MLHQRVKSQLNRYPRIEHHDLPARPQHRIASLRIEEGPNGLFAGVSDDFAFAEHAGWLLRLVWGLLGLKGTGGCHFGV